jgi:drug/metabolite transporter (DMT)-like permease
MEPFFRKDVLQTLNNEEFLFINTLMISILIIAYTIYMYFTKKTTMNIGKKLKTFSLAQIVFLIALAFITFISTVSIFKISKEFNSQNLNALIKTLTTVFALIIGVTFYNEQYTATQIYGIIITIVGIYLITKKD